MRDRLVVFVAALVATTAAVSQSAPFDRLSTEQLEVTPPSARVEGEPGRMRITERSCRSVPLAQTRRRIVDIAIQEWAFFGFQVIDQTIVVEPDPRRSFQRFRLPRYWLDPVESGRVAHSIAGYWAITPDGAWILERQNARWNGRDGVAARWRDPWSAAFISWVMCEGGLGETSQFVRAIAHHSYIDQAIKARGAEAAAAAYVAFNVGEVSIEPGDLLCSARRSAYRSIEDRQRHLGVGVRSHCDIAIKLDPPNNRVLVIGGNVRGAVRMKFLPAAFTGGDGATTVSSVGRGSRSVFAHLKLRAEAIEDDVLQTSPTFKALGDGNAPVLALF